TAVTQLKYARKPIVAAVGRILSLVKLLCPFCIRLPAYFDAFQVVSLRKINIQQCALSQTSGQHLFSDAAYIRAADRKVGVYLQVVIGKSDGWNFFDGPFHCCGHRPGVEYIDGAIQSVVDSGNAYIRLSTFKNLIYGELYTVDRCA